MVAFPDLLFIEAFELNQPECAICLEEFRPDCMVKKVACRHIFHSECLATWARKQSDCPCCRQSLLVSLEPASCRVQNQVRHRGREGPEASFAELEEQSV